jgi:hypothetical protein
MLFVPPPDFLVHSRGRRASYADALSADLLSTPPRSSGRPSDSPYAADRTELLCYLGSLALLQLDPDASLRFYGEAGARGSTPAINAMGFVYHLYPYDERVIEACMRWSARGVLLGSVDAYRERGIYLSQTFHPEALLCFGHHFRHTESVVSAMLFAVARPPRPATHDALVALRFCIANGYGHLTSRLIELTALLKEDTAFWKAFRLRVAGRGRPDRVLKAHLDSDFSTVPYEAVSAAALKLAEESGEPPPGLRARPSADHGSPRLGLRARRVGPPEGPAPRFPVESRTALLLQIFEFASPEFEARNLYICGQFLSHLYRDEPRGVLVSALWRGKSQSDCARDLVQCGFVAAILDDPEFAAECFTKAARLGDRTGSVMTGILLTHRFKQPRDACYFFAQCVVDPVALVYLGLLSGDQAQLERAATVLGVSADHAEMYERIGDLFAHGVKFPHDPGAALLFYGQALIKAEAAGEDIAGLLVKIDRFDPN